MVTILPSARTPWDVIGASLGQNISQNFPSAVQRGYERGLGMSTLDRLQNELRMNPNASPADIAFQLAKAGVAAPGLERAIGPLADIAMRGYRTKGIYGEQSTGQPSPEVPISSVGNVAPVQPSISGAIGTQVGPQGGRAFHPAPAGQVGGMVPNVMTPGQMTAEARRRAEVAMDPAAEPQFLATLQAENQLAENRIDSLKDLAKEQGVPARDYNEFINLGKRYNDVTDPVEWARKTNRDYKQFKNAEQQLMNAWTPGFARGLVSTPKEREANLKKLEQPVKTLVDMGLEDRARDTLADMGMSGTEIEKTIRPLSASQKKAFDGLKRGFFQDENLEGTGITRIGQALAKKLTPEIGENVPSTVSYERAKEVAPNIVAKMNGDLTDFMRNHLTPDTSLLNFRDELWQKGYDWQQINDAFTDLMDEGYKPSPLQQGEMGEMYSQPPRQSLSSIFMGWNRAVGIGRGNR